MSNVCSFNGVGLHNEDKGVEAHRSAPHERRENNFLSGNLVMDVACSFYLSGRLNKTIRRVLREDGRYFIPGGGRRGE